jgi:hypothetical protein
MLDTAIAPDHPKDSAAVSLLSAADPSQRALAAVQCYDIRQRRRSFLVFVRILLKCIERGGDKPLAFQVRQLVVDCIQRHREGRQGYKSLVDSVEKQLHQSLGRHGYWDEAVVYLNHYHTRKAGMLLASKPLSV